MKKLLSLALIVGVGFACSKKSEDVAPTQIPERLEMNVANKGIQTGDTARFSVYFYDKLGNRVTPPEGIVWSSSNSNIATVSQAGISTGKSAGQVSIKATYNTIEATSLLTVVTDNSSVATVTLENVREININGTSTLQAIVKNAAGQVLNGRTITWQSNNSNLVSIEANTGIATGLAYGTANIKATVEGIESNISMVQVIRSAAFANGSVGTAKLRIENSNLKLELASNFVASSSPPDLRVYLTNNATGIAGATEIATLSQRSGMQSWNVPSAVAIGDYRYVLVWCKQFGGVYGRADLGN